MIIFAHLGGWSFFNFRLFGPGLGNSLFPWARSIIYKKKFGLPMIEPAWLNLRIGPLLRQEKDYKFYFNFFNKTTNSISGLKKIYYLLFYKKIPEYKIKFFLKKNTKKIVVVAGAKNYFEDLKGYNDFIKKSINKLIKKEDLKKVIDNNTNFIAMHVRRSDFKLNKKFITPDKWFIKIINILNKNFDKIIYVFSDAYDYELNDILKCKNVQRLSYKNSILELLAMSRSKLFVGSKNSTFSHWASFLGLMPTIWPLNCHINSSRTLSKKEIETDGQTLPKSFINLCRKNFNKKSFHNN